MVIRSSSAREVDRLVRQVRDGSAVEREAAIARLRVIGPRAVERLAALVAADAPADGRAAALKALEGIEDARARGAAARVLADPDPQVAAAAVAVLRPWLLREGGDRVLDVLAAVALDRTRLAVVRLAALDALTELPRQVVQPVWQQAGLDPELVARLAPAQEAGAADEGDVPEAVRAWLAREGRAVPLSEIHEAILRLRTHEREELSLRRRQDWLVVRGAAHALLASRRSRVALYDLRETFEVAQSPLPLDFLTAIARIGDSSCIEPLARAWTAAPGEGWWREHLVEAARTIARREKLGARHAVVKRVKARHPGFF